MPLTPRMHSSRSDGFDTSRGHHAVFHDFSNCFHQQRIVRNGNAAQGRGQDDRGRARDLCSNCRRLWNQLLASQGRGPI